MAEPGFVPPDPRPGCCNRPVVVPAAGPADLPAVSATERCTRAPGHEPPCGEPDVRALTVRQPWASLIATGAKTIETRGWRTGWRGDVLVHAGRGCEVGDFGPYSVEKDNPRGTPPAYLLRGESLAWPYRLPLGAVVAVARLADCVPIVGEDGDLFEQDPPCIEHRPRGTVNAGLWRWHDLADLDDPEHDAAHEDITDQLPLGDFSTDTPRWAWLLTDVRPIDPVPAKGRQGLWRPDDELVAACMEGTSR